jgi:hypothetical protein
MPVACLLLRSTAERCKKPGAIAAYLQTAAIGYSCAGGHSAL